MIPKNTYPVLFFALIVLSFFSVSTSAQTIYVSQNGNDSWSGTVKMPTATDGPLKTIQAAVTKAPEYIKSKPGLDSLVIEIGEGEYLLNSAITITPQFNDLGRCKVIFRGADLLKTRLIGSRSVLPQSANSELQKLTADNSKSHLFFSNDKMYIPATLPANGYFYFTGVKVIKNPNPFKDVQIYNADTSVNSYLFDFLAKLKQQNRFSGINIFSNWLYGSRKIDSFSAAKKEIYTTGITFTDAARWSKDDRFQIINPDQFGYYVDGKLQETLSAQSKFTAPVYIPVNENIFFFKGEPETNKKVFNIEVRNISFEYFDYEKTSEVLPEQSGANSSSAIVLQNAQKIKFSNCHFKNIGKNVFWFKAGCVDSKVVNCTFDQLGEGAVRIGNHGFSNDKANPEKVINSYIFIDSNTITYGGKINYESPGILVLNGRDINIVSNNVSHLFQTGIALGWGWSKIFNIASNILVESNTIHDIGNHMMSDLAGIYVTGPLDGSILRKNTIYNITHYSYGAAGIYADDGSSNILIDGNRTYNTEKTGFLLNNGQNITVTNNMFVKSGEEPVIYAFFKNIKSTMVFKNNIIVNDKNKPLSKGLTLDGIESDQNVYWDNVAKENSVIQGNLNLKQVAARSKNDKHSIVQNPNLQDWDNFQFKVNNPAVTNMLHH